MMYFINIQITEILNQITNFNEIYMYCHSYTVVIHTHTHTHIHIYIYTDVYHISFIYFLYVQSSGIQIGYLCHEFPSKTFKLNKLTTENFLQVKNGLITSQE